MSGKLYTCDCYNVWAEVCMWNLCTVCIFKTDTKIRNAFQTFFCGAALLQIRRILPNVRKLLARIGFCHCHWTYISF